MKFYRVVQFFCLLRFFCLFSNEIIPVELNLNAIKISFIESISHDFVNSRFLIRLKENKNCTEPYFFLRLSGASLITPYQEKLDNHLFSFLYQISLSGLYHLEILFFGCSWELNYASQFVKRCLPTPPEMTINCNFSVQLEAQHNLPVWKNINNETFHNCVKTRYITQICIDASPEMFKFLKCMDMVYRDWFYDYEYTGLLSTNEFNIAIKRFLEKLPENEIFRICFIGASHSKLLFSETEQLLPLLKEQNEIFNKLDFKLINTRLPSLWNKNKTIEIQTCSIAIIAFGQWSLVRNAEVIPKPPYGVKEFRKEMEKIINIFNEFIPKNKLFLRSIHHNGLRSKKINCPPSDWRVPYIIDAYNKELKNLSLTDNISFIDTDFLIRPVWDSAEDFSHYKGKVTSEELKYFLWVVFKDYLDI